MQIPDLRMAAFTPVAALLADPDHRGEALPILQSLLANKPTMTSDEVAELIVLAMEAAMTRVVLNTFQAILSPSIAGDSFERWLRLGSRRQKGANSNGEAT